jgi:formylglycine-generating enzyme required for sulfatase activity/protocatechuate 3,4-dioxygenase beta subunit
LTCCALLFNEAAQKQEHWSISKGRIMFNSRSLKIMLIVVTASLLAAGYLWATENKRNENQTIAQSPTGQAKESGVKMEFVRIPAGSFYMGSPGSRESRKVRITRPFYMGKYEVTQAQWKAVMGTTLLQQRAKAVVPWNLKGEGPEHPMYYVSWEDAVEFCKRLGDDFRLPTEAEWEYACRAGSQTRFHYGNDPNESELSQYAWWWDNSDSETHPVGQKKPNVWGLHDMHGNVREWCSDREDSVISYGWGGGLIDTTGSASDKEPYRVCRGNSWLDKWGRGSAQRGWGKEYFRFDDIGFRVVYTGRIGGDKQVLEIALPEEPAGIAASPAQESNSRPRIIAGVVRNEAGVQIDRADIWILPRAGWILRNYDEGTFEMFWHPSEPEAPMQKYHLVAYNKKSNLAMGMEIDRETSTLDIQLKPGVVLAGKVVDGDGKGIKKADIFIYLQTSDWRPSSYMYTMETDEEGRFEIRALPPGYDYVLSFHSSGYRTVQTEIHSDDMRDNRRDGVSIVLQRGEFSVSGVVVDTDGKPVPNMRVYCTAKGQPAIISHSDADGKFTLDGIFKGRIKVVADGHKLYGSVDTEAGATNVRVVLDNEGAPPGKGRACFPSETGVWVNGGLIPISGVVLGQTIGRLTRAVPTVRFGHVVRIEEHEGAFECRDIVLDSGNHISVVDTHCFMLDSGRWIAAQDLRSGQRLKTLNGAVTIKSVTTRETPYVGKVYNLKVKDSDRYMVGKDGVIVRDY